MNHQTPRIAAAALISALGVLAGSALGQTALGDGTALDASLSTQGRLNVSRPSFATELQFRNAIATGNAPGGMSFRGDLGYRAAGEFTGALGSDSLFAFRRDSLYSGLAGMGIRGTEAVQYQFALTTGATPPRDLMGNLSVSRDYGVQTNRRVGTDSGAPIAINPEIRDMDPRGRSLSTYSSERDDGSLLGTLRSSASYISTSGLQPVLLNVYGEGIERTPYGLTASNLRGVTTVPMYTNAQAFQKDEGEELNTDQFRTSITDLANEQAQRARELTEKRSDPNKAQTTDSPAGEDWFANRMKEIREELYGVPSIDAAVDEGLSGEGDGANPTDPTQPDDSISEKLKELEINYDEEGNPIESDALELTPRLLEILRGDAAPLNKFVNQDISSDDVYIDHIRTGERLIAAERYFDAEERFTRALAIRPGDLTAQIGRIHAQIGAGMVLSASVNLQAILTDFPQLAGTRYSEKLLPSKSRTEALVDGLRIRSGVTRVNDELLHEDPRIRLSSGLLLAYLGYQSLDEQAVSEGLGVVNEVGSDADRRLAFLLEQIWDVSFEKMKTDTNGVDSEE
ncbi:MAG: hypothetical protein KC996_08885 [Phycisphaerales bacterium]|nr:hypothetical protein [Phycisphaerales bacterium]